MTPASNITAEQIRRIAYENGMGAAIPWIVSMTGRSVGEIRAIILQGAGK